MRFAAMLAGQPVPIHLDCCNQQQIFNQPLPQGGLYKLS